MPLVTSDTLKNSYDVIVVGSGAGGGQTAYTFTMEGAKVLMLEAGRNYVPETETPDGTSFASNADKNPTLTIMALARRAADHIAAR
ncbi:MAG: FAD-binding protein [Opitutus sp.]|nr:FAD-binding protein [Opitutus sp.]